MTQKGPFTVNRYMQSGIYWKSKWLLSCNLECPVGNGTIRDLCLHSTVLILVENDFNMGHALAGWVR